MEQIKIKCTSGMVISLDEMKFLESKGKLKKHSLLEVERMVDSIINDGFLFPMAISKVDGSNFIIDGECRYLALIQLRNRGYEIPEIPVFFVKSNKDTIIKNTLIATSTNHCVTKSSLVAFCGDEELLRTMAFNEGTLIDFYSSADIQRYFEEYKNVKQKGISKDELTNFLPLLKEGVI